jgi:uncharacterized membrane protein YkvA (DUF1232 family)
MNNNYGKHYSDKGFTDKIKGLAGKVGFLRQAVAMYFALRDPQTPAWVKAAIVAALGYFILPTDLVPDFIPVAGYADDAGVITTTMGVIDMYVTDQHRAEADKFLGIPRQIGKGGK